jgi:CRISPR-associated protein Csb2
VRGQTDAVVTVEASGTLVDVVAYPYRPLEPPKPGPGGLRALGAQLLISEESGQPIATLGNASTAEWVTRQYLAPASTWSSVTPVVLPGHDDPGDLRQRLKTTRDAEEQARLIQKLGRRTEALVRKSIREAGYGDELAFHSEIEARSVGFLAGVEPARRYAVPQHLQRFPRFHVRITWRTPAGPVELPGPIALGRGRFSGMGLFVGEPLSALVER